MKCMMPMTYRWALGWWKHPSRVLGDLYQRECVSWEVWEDWDRVAY